MYFILSYLSIQLAFVGKITTRYRWSGWRSRTLVLCEFRRHHQHGTYVHAIYKFNTSWLWLLPQWSEQEAQAIGYSCSGTTAGYSRHGMMIVTMTIILIDYSWWWQSKPIGVSIYINDIGSAGWNFPQDWWWRVQGGSSILTNSTCWWCICIYTLARTPEFDCSSPPHAEEGTIVMTMISTY